MCFMNAHKLGFQSLLVLYSGRKGRKEIGKKKGRREGERCKQKLGNLTELCPQQISSECLRNLGFSTCRKQASTEGQNTPEISQVRFE